MVAQYPQSRDARRELGISYYQQHRTDEAMEQFKALQAIDPDDLAAHYNLAILYRRMGMKKASAEQAALYTIKRIDPGAPTYSLDYLRKHPEISTESVPWHVHIRHDARHRPAPWVSHKLMKGWCSIESPHFSSFAQPHRTGSAVCRHPRAGFAVAAGHSRSAAEDLARRSAVTMRSLRRRRRGPSRPLRARRWALALSTWRKKSGLDVKTIYGGEFTNKYLLETTGCGLAFYDYDDDGWLDLFLVNGWRLEGFPAGQEPHCHLFKNNRDGTFTDVTMGSGLEHKTGWGQACCVGDYNNDGHDDLFVTYYGQNALYRNNGNGTFTDVTQAGGADSAGTKDPLEYRLHVCRLRPRWSSRSVRRQLCRLRSEDRAASRRTAPALTREFWWRAGRRDLPGGRIFSITTTATEPSAMSVRSPACGRRSALMA